MNPPQFLEYAHLSPADLLSESTQKILTGANVDIIGTLPSRAEYVQTLHAAAGSAQELIARRSEQAQAVLLSTLHTDPSIQRSQDVIDHREWWDTLPKPTQQVATLTLDCTQLWQRALETDQPVRALVTALADIDPQTLTTLHLVGDLPEPMLALVAFWFWRDVDTLTIDSTPILL